MDKSVHILIVDDDEVDRELIVRGLSTAGINNPVVIAKNGIEALSKLQGTSGTPKIPAPCLVLLDLNMPKMNGHEFLDALMTDPDLGSTIVFALSTSNDPIDIRTCYEKGAAGFMCKDTIAQGLTLLVEFLAGFERLANFSSDRQRLHSNT